MIILALNCVCVIWMQQERQQQMVTNWLVKFKCGRNIHRKFQEVNIQRECAK